MYLHILRDDSRSCPILSRSPFKPVLVDRRVPSPWVLKPSVDLQAHLSLGTLVSGYTRLGVHSSQSTHPHPCVSAHWSQSTRPRSLVSAHSSPSTRLHLHTSRDNKASTDVQCCKLYSLLGNQERQCLYSQTPLISVSKGRRNGQDLEWTWLETHISRRAKLHRHCPFERTQSGSICNFNRP